MIFYKDIPDLNRQLANLPELDYDYAYNSQDLREGYFIFKKKEGTSFSSISVKLPKGFTKGVWREEKEGFYIEDVGDKGKEPGLNKIVVMREGPNLASGYRFSRDYIRLIMKIGDKVPEFKDMHVIEIDDDGEIVVCKYNDKEVSVDRYGNIVSEN